MVVFSDGFETNDFTAWTGTFGVPTVQGLTVHSGSYAAKSAVCGDGAECYSYKTLAAAAILYARTYLRVDSLPADDNDEHELMALMSSAWEYQVVVYIGRVSGTNRFILKTTENGGDSRDTDTAEVPVVNTWYCIEILRDVTNDIEKLYVNGVERVSAAHAITGNTNRLQVGANYVYDPSGAALTAWWDCAVADSTYIGPEAAGVTVKKGSNLASTMTTMLNSKMLFSACNRFPKLVPRHF
jgi:hypothetical protein